MLGLEGYGKLHPSTAREQLHTLGSARNVGIMLRGRREAQI